MIHARRRHKPIYRTCKDAEEVAGVLLALARPLPEALDERLRVLPVPARVLDPRDDFGVRLEQPLDERVADGDAGDGWDMVEVDPEPVARGPTEFGSFRERGDAYKSLDLRCQSPLTCRPRPPR